MLVIVLEHWGEQYQWVLLQVLVYPRGNLGEEVVEEKNGKGLRMGIDPGIKQLFTCIFSALRCAKYSLLGDDLVGDAAPEDPLPDVSSM